VTSEGLPGPRAPTDFFGFFGALKKGDFFGVHTKKVPPGAGAQRPEVSRREAQVVGSVPVFPRPRTTTAEPWLKTRGTFLGSTPKYSARPHGWKNSARPPPNGGQKKPASSPAGPLLCLAKHPSKIFCRNFPAARMLQQTEKIFARDSSAPCYTRARKEFRGIRVNFNSPRPASCRHDAGRGVFPGRV
jgi:hypothetical protein